ncbi:MAG TPA: ThiF family adenylyltransferase [Pyrinomonadaceae bacterium]|nr:ThiF family adenylyltransferase [Pyrinomonadaceae bacterium]
MAGSVVLVTGAGALGQNVVYDLALAGVGEIRIVDQDYFEPHNRTRSPLFPSPEEQEQYGSAKAPTVARKLKPLMTAAGASVRHAHSWIEALGDGAFKNVSAVLACVDKPSARAYLADKARLHGIGFIEAGFDGADISLSCFPAVRGEEAGTTPCWRCSHQEIEGEGTVFSCLAYARNIAAAGFVPAIQNAAATLAGLQAEAAILSLHEAMPLPLKFRAMDLNIRSGQSRIITLLRDPDCPGVHRHLDTAPTKLTASANDTVSQLLHELNDFFGAPARIELNPGLVWSAACTNCTEIAEVRKRVWEWAANSRCEQCDGPFARTARNGAGSPIIHYYLDSESNEQILNRTCAEIGFPPLAFVEASAENGPIQLFEMAGSVENLFQSGETL